LVLLLHSCMEDLGTGASAPDRNNKVRLCCFARMKLRTRPSPVSRVTIRLPSRGIPGPQPLAFAADYYIVVPIGAGCGQVSPPPKTPHSTTPLDNPRKNPIQEGVVAQR